MTIDKAIEKTNKYNYLVGKRINQDSIAAIMPIPIDDCITVKKVFTAIFNNVPYDKTFGMYNNFMIAVIFNYQEFQVAGVVIWKSLDDVLKMLEIED